MKKTLLTAVALMALASPIVATPAFAKTRIHLAMNRDDDRFVNILKNSLLSAAQNDSEIEITVSIAGNNGDTQLDQVKAAIAADAEVVIALPVDDKTSLAIGEATGNARTPLIYLNRRPPADRFKGPVAIVSSNDLVAGRLQMRVIAGKINNTGNVVILRGEDGHPAAKERTQGVKEILATKPGIHVLHEETGNWSRAEAEKLVTQWLAEGQPINAILANNDEMALGAIDAMQKAGIPPGQIYVAGVDGTTDALDAIRSGYLTLSLLQNANAQGTQALVDAKKLAGKQYAELYDWVPYELIIPSNLETYAGQ